MDTTGLKKFAQGARRQLLEQVATRLEQVLRSDSIEIREKARVVAELKKQIEASSKKAMIDRVAYTWFNRFCALRFMDVNHYTRIGAVSPVEGGTQPEVLLEAKQGHIDDEMLPDAKKRQEIFDLLNGKRPASDPQGEAYRLLLVGICNSYSDVMPFMFEKIEDYTELLMPLDLLSENSVIYALREALSVDACQDVEVIGWLYQYYISERKDQVFEALKQNQKIEAGDIPAATQLFTPHWIVRYLVENSLGRLWMLNHPDSKLRDRMDYYIAVDSEKWEVDSTAHSPLPTISDHLIVNSPEEIKLIDPACGSGHILTYAFDLLAAIYEEQGYAAPDIAKLILEKNIFGIEIDQRAGALAAFALVMKARAKDRRFFTRGVSPNICVLENVTFSDAELKQYMSAVGRDLFTEPLKETLLQFEQADNFGSLIRPILTDTGYVRGLLEGKNLGGDMFYSETHKKVMQVLEQAEFLAPRYHVVVANPPYMGRGSMNPDLIELADAQFLDSKIDLFAMFIERNLELTRQMGLVAMITMQSWMFLSSYEKLRKKLINQETILTMAHLGAHAFDTIGGEVVSTTAFVIAHVVTPKFKGKYFRLVNGRSESEKSAMLLESIPTFDNKLSAITHTIDAHNFEKISGQPIAYWVSNQLITVFEKGQRLERYAKPKLGMRTGDNERFLKFWHEVGIAKCGFGLENASLAKISGLKWFPYHKGGKFRRWYGNHEYVVNWENDGYEIKKNTLEQYPQLSWDNLGWKISNEQDFFKFCIIWSRISSEYLGVRFSYPGFIFDTNGSAAFPETVEKTKFLTAFLCTPIASKIVSLINPSLAFQPGDLASIPMLDSDIYFTKIVKIAESLIDISNFDWDSYETSWAFSNLPLLKREFHDAKLRITYMALSSFWRNSINEMKLLEEENNSVFIEAYGLQDEMTPTVPLDEITLTCNPYYRYGSKKSGEELEALLLADTMKEFISYAVGCMFGRYSLDKPGLVLANQGETLKDYLRKVCSEEWVVDSNEVEGGKLEVGSLPTTHYPLSTNPSGGNHDNSAQLQRTDRLAEGNESCGKRISGNETVPERRTLRSYESSQAISGVDSFQHSGRSSQKIDGGISEFLVNCERFKSRDGDPNPACPALELCNQRNSQSNSQSIGRSEQNAVWADEQSQQVSSDEWKVDSESPTTHYPLSTELYPLSTELCPLSTVTFLPDEDNVIPVLEGEWFSDDIAERFKDFLRVTFGKEHYDENLAFIEEAIGRDVRSYFVKEFYKDHVQTYKKRPIYWMFSSPRGSFNALIYMHRYQPHTVSIVLNDYLREYIKKLAAHKVQLERTSVSGSASQSQKTKALKEVTQVNKVLSELKEYEDDVLYPLATEQVKIDLDDGVKVNYGKFGNALQKIVGL